MIGTGTTSEVLLLLFHLILSEAAWSVSTCQYLGSSSLVNPTLRIHTRVQ